MCIFNRSPSPSSLYHLTYWLTYLLHVFSLSTCVWVFSSFQSKWRCAKKLNENVWQNLF